MLKLRAGLSAYKQHLKMKVDGALAFAVQPTFHMGKMQWLTFYIVCKEQNRFKFTIRALMSSVVLR